MFLKAFCCCIANDGFLDVAQLDDMMGTDTGIAMA
jgi:hypothetical protein